MRSSDVAKREREVGAVNALIERVQGLVLAGSTCEGRDPPEPDVLIRTIAFMCILAATACGPALSPRPERAGVTSSGRVCVADDGERGAVLAAISGYASELLRERTSEQLAALGHEFWPVETSLAHCDLPTSGMTFVLGEVDGTEVRACWIAGAPPGAQPCDAEGEVWTVRDAALAGDPSARGLLIWIGTTASYFVEWTADGWRAHLDHWVDV